MTATAVYWPPALVTSLMEEIQRVARLEPLSYPLLTEVFDRVAPGLDASERMDFEANVLPCELQAELSMTLRQRVEASR
jgi:hypothetical protein